VTKKLILCSPRELPKHQWIAAAHTATTHNPANHPQLSRIALAGREFAPTRAEIAVVTSKYWGGSGVHLSVSFLDSPSVALRKRILEHMNAWASTANARFSETTGTGQVRIARAGGKDGGYWSYVGTDIEHIPLDEPTMNLEGFTMNTPEKEYRRVVRHETGHTLGCPHEHMRKAIVDLIDRQRAISYFAATQGWDEQMVIRQVLTPLEEASIMGTENTDQTSIMCYQLPGNITTNHQPIIGGIDINPLDAAFMGTMYPPPAAPVTPSGKGKARKKTTTKKKTAARKAAKAARKQQAGNLELPAVAAAPNGNGIWSDEPGGKALTIKLSVSGPIAQLWLYRVGGDDRSGQITVDNGAASVKVLPATYRLLTRGKTSAPSTEYEIEITSPDSATWKPNPARRSDPEGDILDFHKVVVA
jgi:hypothetical protein